MGLCLAIAPFFRLFDQLCRRNISQPSLFRNNIFIRPVGRPTHFASRVYCRLEIFRARRDLDFCRGYLLVVSTRPSHASCVFGIHSPK